MKIGRIILAAFLLVLLISTGGAVNANYYGVENFGIMSDGQMIGSLNGQETVNAFVQFTNHENAFDSIIFLAVYKDGKLIDLEITRVADHAGEDIIVSEPVDVSEKGITVKAILLYDTETLEPRGPAVELGKGVRLRSDQVLDVTQQDNTVMISYRENETDTDTKTIQFAADAECYLNNMRYYSAEWDNLLWQHYGTLEIVKSDEGRKTDSVYITTYKNLCVDTVDTEHKRVSGKNTSRSIFYGENAGDIILYGPDGKKMDWESLREWDILAYTELEGSNGQMFYRAWLIRHPITGTVEAIENEGTRDVRYTINGQIYGIDNIMDYSDSFLVGETGTFYLDKLGNIAWHDTVVPYKVNYSYIDDAVYYEGDSPTLQFRVFTKEGRMESYLLDTNVQADGVPMNLSGVSRQELDVIGSRYKGELIVFKTGEDGRIISFETGAKKGEFTKYESEYASVVYSKTTNAFKPAEKSPRFANDNTVIFCVPQGEPYTSDNYEILNLKDIVDKQEFQNVTFYNVDNKFGIGVILIKGYVPAGPRTITSTKLHVYEDVGVVYVKDEGEAVTIHPAATVYWNGEQKSCSEGLVQLLESVYGTITLEKTGGCYMDEYDTIRVTQYQNLVVDSVDTENRVIYPKDTNTTFSYDGLPPVWFEAEQREIPWQNLQEYDVVSYTVSDITGKVNGAQLSRQPVYGIIDKAENQGTPDAAFWIDDYRYPIAYNLELAALKIGDIGAFYQDAIGNIAWYDTDTPITLRSSSYAYIHDAVIDNATLQLQLYTYAGELKPYNLAKQVAINGVQVDSANLATQETAEAYKGKIIVFAINEDDEITALSEAKDSNAPDVAWNDFTQYGQEIEAVRYVNGDMLYAWDSKVHVNGKTCIMVVPQGNTDGYKIIDIDSVIDTQAFYDVTFYNINKGGYAALMVVKQPFENLGGASVGVMNSVSPFMNNDGITLSKIHALRENTYIEYITALQEGIPSPGSAFAPVLSGNGRADRFKSYTKMENGMVSLGEAAVNVNATRFYLGDIQQTKGQTVILEDDTTLVIPSTANMYVYDVRLEPEKRLSKDGSLDNVVVTYNSWNGPTYEDRLGKISDYVLFAREYQGRIMDVILYINVPLDA